MPHSATFISSALSIEIVTTLSGPCSTRLSFGIAVGDGGRAKPNTTFAIAGGGIFNNNRD